MTDQKQFTFTRRQVEKLVRSAMAKANETTSDQFVPDLFRQLEEEMDAWMAGEGELEMQSGAFVDQGLKWLAMETSMLAYKNDLRDAKERIDLLNSLIDAKNKAISEEEKAVAVNAHRWAESEKQVKVLQQTIEGLTAQVHVEQTHNESLQRALEKTSQRFSQAHNMLLEIRDALVTYGHDMNIRHAVERIDSVLPVSEEK